MIVAMAKDVRVILIKLADRLHNMRTIEYLGKQKQVQKAKETLEVYAPLAHRLGIHALKWELEDLSFQILHPRKYAEIKAMVADRREAREQQVDQAGTILGLELEKADIPVVISGRAKHFYSIYDKMAKKGREFNEIYDLTAMRVIAERSGDDGTRDCYGALGIIHSLWKPMPGRFKDFIAMPKLNRYRSLHTTVIGPAGTPLEIQVRTREMHEEAELGVAAHWLYKRGKAGKQDDEWLTWVRSLMDWQGDEQDAAEFMRTLRTDLFDDEVYVFTPKGEVKTLPGRREADRLRVRRAHRRRAPHRRREGERPDRAAPLPAQERRLRRDPHLEVGARAVTRLAVARRLVAGAQQDPAVVPARDEGRDGAEGPRRARPGAQGAEPAVPEAPGLERARLRDPRPRLQEGGGLLPRARLGEDRHGAGRQQGAPAPEDRRGRRRAGDHHQAGRPQADRHRRLARRRRARRRGRARPAREVLHARARATRSRGTSRSAAGSRSTAPTART